MERRKWNLIVFNVPEPKSTESSQRKVEDWEFFNSLIDHIGIDPVDVTDVVRLGAKTSDKLRPLRVQLNNLGHRRSVLANAKKLRDLSSDIFKGIYDLSVKERQAQKKLRSELARRKENGETDIFIRRGRIMKQRNSDHSQWSTSELMDNQSA